MTRDPEPQRLTGTEDRPIERIPEGPGTRLDWLVLLAGPTIWISHFMVVYLAAEVVCEPADPDQWSFLGEGAVIAVTVLATLAALAGCGAAAWFTRRRMARRDPHGPEHYVVDVARTGFLAAVGAAVGVIAVGAPVLYLSPLC